MLNIAGGIIIAVFVIAAVIVVGFYLYTLIEVNTVKKALKDYQGNLKNSESSISEDVKKN